MILAGLLIGSGATYLGTQISQRYKKQLHNKQKLEYPQRLVDKLSIFDDPQIAQTPLERRVPLGLVVSTGMVVAGGFLWWASATGMTPLLLTNRLISLLRNSSYGPAIYLAGYTVGPLLLFPTTLLTVAGGLVFGPILGMALAVIGSSASSMIAYGIGRRLKTTQEQLVARRKHARRGNRFAPYLKQDEARAEISHLKVLKPYIERMQAHPFSTTVTMHLLFLPFDLVSYGAGALALNWPLFMLGTMVGSLPATLFLVQAGAVIPGGILTGIPHVNAAPLVVSGLIFVGSIAFARRLNQRQRNLPIMVDPSTPIAIGTDHTGLSLSS